MPFAAFLMEPQPQPLSMLEKVPNPHRHRRAHPGETVDHDADQGAVAQADEFWSVSIEFSSCRISCAGEHRRLAARDHVLGAAHRTCRGGARMPPVTR